MLDRHQPTFHPLSRTIGASHTHTRDNIPSVEADGVLDRKLAGRELVSAYVFWFVLRVSS